MSKGIEKQIGETLANESGGGFGFVCIWRLKSDPLYDGESDAKKCTVGEFLSIDKNKKGIWLIDGGWGSPPGAIHVRWNNETHEWENGGYCGGRFSAS